MAAGFRSLFAFWSGGAGSVTPVTSGGARSLLAHWIGGASSPTAAVSGGYRSLLAFWMGGATNGPEAESQQRDGKGWERFLELRPRRLTKPRKMPKEVFDLVCEIAQEEHQDYKETLKRELEWKNLQYKAEYGKFLVQLVREIAEYEARMRQEAEEIAFIGLMMELH